MSAKKKKIKQAWIEVSSGKFILPIADVGKGDGTPKKGLNNSRLNESSPMNKRNSSSPVPLVQPCINDNILVCQVAIRPPDKDVNLLPSTISKTILLNTETMKIMQLIIDDCVTIYTTMSSGWTPVSTYRVWPNNSVPLGKIGMSKDQMIDCDVTTYSSCMVRKATTEVASRIHLLPVNYDVTDECLWDNLKRFLPEYMRCRTLIKHQQIRVIFYGKQLTFRVHHIQPRDHDVIDDASSLSDEYSKMKLTDDTDDDPFSSTAMMTSSKPPTAYVSTRTTEYDISGGGEVVMRSDDVTSDQDDDVIITLDDVGGMSDVIDKLRYMVVTPMNDPHLYHQLGERMKNAVILHGSSGTGKSLLARALAHETGAIIKELHHNKVDDLEKTFDELKEMKKSVVLLIDDIEQICPNTNKKNNITFNLISCLDDLNNLFNKKGDGRCKIYVIATTNNLDNLHEKLLHQFHQVEIPVPTQHQRHQILLKLLKNIRNNLNNEEMTELAYKCHGFVGSDLKCLVSEASLNCIRQYQSTTDDKRKQIELKNEDFIEGLKHVNPSAIRELVVRVPNVKWSDIGGYNDVKKLLHQVIELPLKRAHDFIRMGIAPPRGVLLYGPPGCSKTLTAKALATQSGLNFVSIKGSELYSKYVGDSEKSLRNIFTKARLAAPSIIFFDEIDAIASKRGSSNNGNQVSDRVLTTLLALMDGVEQANDVIVVAATNRPQILDQALLRPGRIDRIIHVPLPDEESRRAILQLRFSKMLINKHVQIDQLVNKTQYFSGAEICRLCDEAGILAIEENADDVTMEHLHRALKGVKPQSSVEDVEMYKKFAHTNAFQ